MSQGEKPQGPGQGGAPGNLLSSVAPPSGLPTFVTAVPASQLPPSMQRQPTSQIDNDTQLPQPTSVAVQNIVDSAAAAAAAPCVNLAPVGAPATLQTSTLPLASGTTSPDKFSPAIPPKKGEPTVSIRSPEDSQTTTQSPVSLPDVDAFGDPIPGSGLLTWMRGAVSTGGLLKRVAERAKSSVDSMITTLDPQMKEYLNSGGDVHIVVASNNEWDVSPVREAFQAVFGKATVIGMPVADTGATAAQAVGAGAAYAAAKHRMATLRAHNMQLHNNVPIVALEGFLMQVPGDKWLEATLLVISQPSLGIELQTVSQCTGVPAPILPALHAATPHDYAHAETGLAATAASVIAQSLQVAPQDWHETLTGVSRREIVLLAARALAGTYDKLLRLSSGVPT